MNHLFCKRLNWSFDQHTGWKGGHRKNWSAPDGITCRGTLVGCTCGGNLGDLTCGGTQCDLTCGWFLGDLIFGGNLGDLTCGWWRHRGQAGTTWWLTRSLSPRSSCSRRLKARQKEINIIQLLLGVASFFLEFLSNFSPLTSAIIVFIRCSAVARLWAGMFLPSLDKSHFCRKQELRMLSSSLSDCKSLLLYVMIRVSQFVSNSQLCHYITKLLSI